MGSILHSIALLACICLLLQPVVAFGAGDIPIDAKLNGFVWRHGDIASSVLLNLPISFKTNWKFTKLEMQQIYFGNWLRDFSQIVDTGGLKAVSEEALRVVVCVMAFLQFGYATKEFDVTQERLGCYRHEEHIDNPRGYPSDAKEYDDRLRGPVRDVELEIDEKTGMKNFIANAEGDWDTSADFIRNCLRGCIDHGRSGSKEDSDPKETRAHRMEAFRLLGTALHTLEDFPAHSNFVELVLQQLGEDEVFPMVGDKCRCKPPNSDAELPPIVTGTFGMQDLYTSLLGEVDDKLALESEGCNETGELDALVKKLNVENASFDAIFQSIRNAVPFLSLISSEDKKVMEDRIEKISEAAEQVKKGPDDLVASPKGGKNNVVQNQSAFWKAIEPALALHDDILKWFAENEDEEIEASEKQSQSRQTIVTYINNFVYSYLSMVVQPLVTEIRDAVRMARDEINKAEASGNITSIFSDDSCSDPSHSLLAKDHYTHVLNTPSGLVATVCVNLATQEIVRCWDDPTKDAEKSVDEILSILHNPGYIANKGTIFQKQMHQAVESWWTSLSDDDKKDARERLSKEGVRKGLHHRKVTYEMFQYMQKGPFIFEGSAPSVINRPRPTESPDTVEAIQKIAEALLDSVTGLKDGAVTAAQLAAKSAPALPALSSMPGVKGMLTMQGVPGVPGITNAASTLMNGTVNTIDAISQTVGAGKVGSWAAETVIGKKET